MHKASGLHFAFSTSHHCHNPVWQTVAFFVLLAQEAGPRLELAQSGSRTLLLTPGPHACLEEGDRLAGEGAKAWIYERSR